MAYTEADVRPLGLWRHVKTNSLYIVLSVGRCSTNGPREGVERSVVYWSLTHKHLCYRDVGEFLDGRFCPVPPADPAAEDDVRMQRAEVVARALIMGATR
jgi:hypothetical protein